MATRNLPFTQLGTLKHDKNFITKAYLIISVASRYLARGMPLEFGEDQVAGSPPSWVKDSRLQFKVRE
mgnify:CR=1 FL=1